MWETREVDIKVTLPPDIADQAEEVQKSDPEFLARVLRRRRPELVVDRAPRDPH